MRGPKLPTHHGRCLGLLGAFGLLACAAGGCRPSSADSASEAAPAGPLPRPAAFPLRLSPDRRYVVDWKGEPFLVQGDAAWSLIAKLTDEDAETYLEDRRRRRFDAVLVSLIEHKFTSRPPANAYGQAPFARPGDFTAPNEAYFAHADGVLRRAAGKGIAVFLVPAYLGQKGEDEGWYQEMRRAGPDALRAYGRYVGQRYASFDNIVWVLGGDYTPPSEGIAIERAFGEGLREADAGRHLMTAHWDAEMSALDLPDPTITSWLDLDTTYTYRPVYEKSLADWRRPGGRPHILIETTYEREHDSTPRQIRAQAYGALLTGAVGQFFGSGPIWGFWSWRAALGARGSVDMTHVRELFDGLPWTLLVPDDPNQILLAGSGERGTNDFALLASARDGSLAVAYVPTRRSITLDLSRLHMPLRARWYDPTSGTSSPAAGSPYATPAATVFATPGPNAGGDPDWVLVLEPVPATRPPPPGASSDGGPPGPG
ncbi:MAG: DUF4038 domain-containing protein [Myxococcales bacterium]|nr:DUF4038 domain-containing protein [Myxococcales bacterium]